MPRIVAAAAGHTLGVGLCSGTAATFDRLQDHPLSHGVVAAPSLRLSRVPTRAATAPGLAFRR